MFRMFYVIFSMVLTNSMSVVRGGAGKYSAAKG